jgi:hypothetical protein
MLSLTMRDDKESGVGKIIDAKIKNHPQSAEWKKRRRSLSKLTRRRKSVLRATGTKNV